MKAMALMFGGPKGGDKKPPEGASPFGKSEPAEPEGGGMDGARKDAARAVAKALGSETADVDSLDSALQAFVEACSSGGYSDKE
jgi:hypothetical protein